MDAVADYAAATALLGRPLPAYVSYTARSHAKFDAIVHDDTNEVVVRTKDRTVIRGQSAPQVPYVQIGDDKPNGNEAITDPAFVPRCYIATGARIASYEASQLEAIALRDKCAKSKDDKDFDTLFVDPATHRPVAAVGTQNDTHVDVHLVQKFIAVRDYVLPSSLYVRVQGSGLMGWLDVLYDCRYENYRLGASQP
jgi:hypothetical protein